MENGWKMEVGKCTPHGPPARVAFQWYPFFAAKRACKVPS
jgi:hypothetical protein